MAHINLLPWREELREERRREFIVLLIGIVIIAAGILFLVDRHYRNQISDQRARNDFLNREIAVLDARIADIRELREQKQQITDRMSVIQDLQGSRPLIVRLFDELVKTLPTGVYYDRVERRGDTLEIDGVASSNNRVSELMRRLDDSVWFQEPNLIQIAAASRQGSPVNIFSLTMTVKNPEQGPASANASGAGSSGGAN